MCLDLASERVYVARCENIYPTPASGALKYIYSHVVLGLKRRRAFYARCRHRWHSVLAVEYTIKLNFL